MPSDSCEWRLPRSERRWRGRIAINNRGLCTRNLVSMHEHCMHSECAGCGSSCFHCNGLQIEVWKRHCSGHDMLQEMVSCPCDFPSGAHHMTLLLYPHTQTFNQASIAFKKKKMLKIISYVQWNTWHLVDLSRHGTFSLSACARCDNWVPRNLSGYS